MATEKILALGHRGTRIHAPENTLEAFDACLAHGCDGFELDARCTSDGQIVVVHDADVNGIDVETSTCQQLQTVSTLPIPLLRDVMARYQDRAFINIEMKTAGMGREIAEMVGEFPNPKGVLVSSFLPHAIREFHDAAPQLDAGYICRDPELLPYWKELPITNLVLFGFLVTEELLNNAHAAEKQVWIWTLNTEKEIRYAMELGVDGIISDDSRLLGEIIPSNLKRQD
jgi:glycerophosphoryl diester phosphodiesterase